MCREAMAALQAGQEVKRGRKRFFFEKKNQKTFKCAARHGVSLWPGNFSNG
jgi:hypothetical protein